jgi:hypothetical protein
MGVGAGLGKNEGGGGGPGRALPSQTLPQRAERPFDPGNFLKFIVNARFYFSI